jgi:CRP-like cAMP-binding protein
MVVRVSGNETAKPAPSQPNKLARQDAFWSEFKIRGGSKLFGEAEPADYVYQIREGAVRTYKRLFDGRRQIGAFHLPGDILAVENCKTHRFTAEAIVDTTVWIAKRRSLFAGLDYEQHGEAGAEVLRHHLFACQIEVGDRRGRKEGDRGHQQQRLARNHQHTDDG